MDPYICTFFFLEGVFVRSAWSREGTLDVGVFLFSRAWPPASPAGKSWRAVMPNCTSTDDSDKSKRRKQKKMKNEVLSSLSVDDNVVRVSCHLG
jgi:hypothetical protein